MLGYFSSGSLVAFCKNCKKTKNQKKKKYAFKFLISKKNIEMYAGPPKIAQELFFWSYGLRVRSAS